MRTPESDLALLLLHRATVPWIRIPAVQTRITTKARCSDVTDSLPRNSNTLSQLSFTWSVFPWLLFHPWFLDTVRS